MAASIQDHARLWERHGRYTPPSALPHRPLQKYPQRAAGGGHDPARQRIPRPGEDRAFSALSKQYLAIAGHLQRFAVCKQHVHRISAQAVFLQARVQLRIAVQHIRALVRKAQTERIVALRVRKGVYFLQHAGDRGLRLEHGLQGERHREHEQPRCHNKACRVPKPHQKHPVRPRRTQRQPSVVRDAAKPGSKFSEPHGLSPSRF